VKLHVAAMLRTLGVQNRTQAAAMAHQAGLSEPS
jgi:DNA-binding NarL/FixJ family response regulator